MMPALEPRGAGSKTGITNWKSARRCAAGTDASLLAGPRNLVARCGSAGAGLRAIANARTAGPADTAAAADAAGAPVHAAWAALCLLHQALRRERIHQVAGRERRRGSRRKGTHRDDTQCQNEILHVG